MKKLSLVFYTCVVMLTGSAFTPSGRLLWADAFGELNLSEKKGERIILSTMGEGAVNFSSDLVKKARSLSAETKVAVIRELVRAARQYTASPGFRKDYLSWRDERLGYKQKGLGALRNPLGALENKVDKEIDRQINKADDEKRYPSDPTVLIRHRLEAFMQLSATVNFEAPTRSNGGTVYFVNGSDEAQSNEWKACFRAGAPVVNAAREEVKVWLEAIK